MASLAKIYKEDQADRLDSSLSHKVIIKRDSERRELVREILKSEKVFSAKGLYVASMIFHHSGDLSDLKLARKLAKLSSGLDYKKALWLFAAITDRILMLEKKPQKFGTQFVKKNAKAPWKLYPVNKRTTDKQRAEYNVPPLQTQVDLIEKMNQ